MTGEFTDYDELNDRQQMEARMARPRWVQDGTDFGRFAFFVLADGHISKRAGQHRITAAESKRLDASLGLDYRGNPEKGDIRHFVTTKFSMGK